MLKKLGIILLMFIYGVTTVGATVHLHFCMDKFIGWDLSQTQNNTCSKCGMKESATKKGCCKDEVKQLKIDTDHQKSSAAIFVSVFHPPIINAVPSLFEFTKAVFDENSNSINYSPPLLPTIQKLTVLYCTYRI
jgi:hypothetical protein